MPAKCTMYINYNCQLKVNRLFPTLKPGIVPLITSGKLVDHTYHIHYLEIRCLFSNPHSFMVIAVLNVLNIWKNCVKRSLKNLLQVKPIKCY